MKDKGMTFRVDLQRNPRGPGQADREESAFLWVFLGLCLGRGRLNIKVNI